MATRKDDKGPDDGVLEHGPSGAESPITQDDEVVGAVVEEEEQKYAFEDSRKLGVTGSVFLILNKMIGTGSKSKNANLLLLLSDFTV